MKKACISLVFCAIWSSAPAREFNFTPSVDTYIDESLPSFSFGTENRLSFETSLTKKQALIKFDCIGSLSSNRVPDHSLIEKIKLTLTKDSASGFSVRRLLKPWDGSASWGDDEVFGGDGAEVFQLDVENLPQPTAAFLGFSTATLTITDVAQDWWANHGDQSNYGVLIAPRAGDSFLNKIHSAESPGKEPKLTVTFWQPGDVNKDGVFDQVDLISMHIAGRYQQGAPATWEQGDIIDGHLGMGHFGHGFRPVRGLRSVTSVVQP
jgi:hypothetical protein